jgi:hypothetical protein
MALMNANWNPNVIYWFVCGKKSSDAASIFEVVIWMTPIVSRSEAKNLLHVVGNRRSTVARV